MKILEHHVQKYLSVMPKPQKVIRRSVKYFVIVALIVDYDFCDFITLKLDATKIVKAPMPGLVKSLSVSVGESVDEGQEICVIGEVTNSFISV